VVVRHTILHGRQAVITPSYVPCRVLWEMVKLGGGSIADVAAWYQITEAEVEEAVRYWHCWLTRPVGWPVAKQGVLM
jgi:uncharacterized protein (DUF433 family)